MGKRLRFDIHLVDGSVARFYQEGVNEIARILSGISVARFYREGVLMIGGSYSATCYPTQSITHVVFEHDYLPNWADLNDEAPFQEIAREEFLAMAQAPVESATPRARPGGELTTCARLGLYGGGKIYVEIKTHVSARLEQRQLLQRLFQAPCYYIRREGGAVLLNTANLVGVSFFPGPPELPGTAWPAHHYIETKDDDVP